MPLTASNESWKTAERNHQEWEIFHCNYGNISKTEHCCRKSNNKRHSSGHLDCIFDRPRRKFPPKIRKDVARSSIFFLIQKRVSQRLSFGTCLDNLLRFCNKNTCIQISSSEISTQKRSFLIKKLFPQIVLLLVLSAFLTILTKLSTETSKLFSATDF